MPVAAAVQPHSVRLSTWGQDQVDAAKLGKGSFRSDSLWIPALGFGKGGGLTVQHGPCSTSGIKAVGFVMKVAQLPIWTHDVQHSMPLGQKIPGPSGAIGTGAFDARGFGVPQPGGPCIKTMILTKGSRNRHSIQTGTRHVDWDHDMVRRVHLSQ